MTEPGIVPRPTPVRRLWGWLLDYAFVGYWMARAVLDRSRSDQWLHPPSPRSPVLLIPGVFETWQFLQPLAEHLHRRGHPVHVLDQLRYNTGAIPEMAVIVSTYLDDHDLDDVTVIAHSKGGLIAKQAMAQPSSFARIRRVVAVNTPFSGSRYASWFLLPSVRMFAPNGPIIRALSLEVTVNRQISSLYSVFDPHVPESSRLEGAENVVLPTIGHFRPLGDQDTLELITAILERPVSTDPAEGLSDSTLPPPPPPKRVKGRAGRQPLDLLVAGRQTTSPPIVLLPGLGYREMLLPLMTELSAWTTVIMLDLPGWQRQRPTASAPTVAGMAETTVSWLRRSGGPPPILLGHSTGAQAALRAALAAPDDISGLVLASPTIDPAARTWPRLVARFCQPLWREPPTEMLAIRRSVVAGGISPLVRLIDSALADRPEDLMAQLSTPTLIMAGRHDRVATVGWCRHLAGLGATDFRVLPGGHNFCFPHAALVSRTVQDVVRPWLHLETGRQRTGEHGDE